MEVVDHVYGAALVACADEQTAAEVTEIVLAAAARAGTAGDPAVRPQLVREAVLLGVRLDPAARFAALPAPCRAPIALARLTGATVDDIAARLGVERRIVLARLRDGLRAAGPVAAGAAA